MPAVRGGATLTAGAKAAPMSGAASTARASEASRVGWGRVGVGEADERRRLPRRAQPLDHRVQLAGQARTHRARKTMRAGPGARASRSRRTG